MGMIRDEFPNKVGEAEAVQRLKLLTDYWQKKHGLTANWDGTTGKVNGKVMGITFNATITVSASSVVAEGTDPGFLFRSKAKEYLSKKINEYLDPAVTPDDLAKRGDRD